RLATRPRRGAPRTRSPRRRCRRERRQARLVRELARRSAPGLGWRMIRAFAPRPQSHSITEMTEYVLPQHTNAFGGVFGGQIMAWVDLCAAIASARHAGSACVTAYVDDLHFKGPVLVGEVVRLKARVTACFNTSLEVEVDVTGENPQSG